MTDGKMVPDGWRVARLGDVAVVIMGQSPPGQMVLDWDGTADYKRGLPFIQGNAEFGTKSPSPLKWCVQPAKVASPEDLLISVRAPVGQTNRADRQLSIGRGLAAIRFSEGTRSFGWHLVNRAKDALVGVAQGSTFQAIGVETLRSLPVLLPPLAEQRAIAAVLDSIDHAIERTEEFIAVTERLRDALLHQLLTRGVPGWHSEWKEAPGIGTIPASWDVVRLGDVAEVRSGTTPSRKRSDYWVEGSVPFIKTGRVNDVFIREPDEFITTEAVVNAGAVVVPEGSVLIAMIGQGKTRGMTAKLGFSAAINQNFAAVYGPRGGFDLDFFFAWASHNYSLIRALGQGSNQDALNRELIQKMLVPLPSIAEQKVIAATLDGVDEAMGQARVETDMLKCLKSSAADALLTGRVRVQREKYND